VGIPSHDTTLIWLSFSLALLSLCVSHTYTHTHSLTHSRIEVSGRGTCMRASSLIHHIRLSACSLALLPSPLAPARSYVSLHLVAFPPSRALNNNNSSVLWTVLYGCSSTLFHLISAQLYSLGTDCIADASERHGPSVRMDRAVDGERVRDGAGGMGPSFSYSSFPTLCPPCPPQI
jgi:hypothetical protein